MISRAESAALEGWISMEKKTILVVGLGLIGGSLSMEIGRASCRERVCPYV